MRYIAFLLLCIWVLLAFGCDAPAKKKRDGICIWPVNMGGCD